MPTSDLGEVRAWNKELATPFKCPIIARIDCPYLLYWLP